MKHSCTSNYLQKPWPSRWVILLLLCFTSVYAPGQAVNIYVSDKAGSDAYNGTLSKPYKTINKARIEALKYKNPMKGDINIIIKGGTYFLDAPLEFTAKDSGCNGFKVKYGNHNNEEVILSGGKRIETGWTQHKNYKENGIWQIDLSGKNIRDKDGTSWFAFRQLWVDGTKAKRARSSISIVNESAPTSTAEKYKLQFANDASGTKIRKAEHKEDMEIWTAWQWMANIVKIASISSDNKITTHYTTPYYVDFLSTTDRPQTALGIENAFEFVDEPGEWFFNRHINRLFYYPKNGKNPNESEIIFPVLEKLIQASGVSNIEFQGLTFSHATWAYPNKFGYITGQGSIFVQYVPGRGNIHHVVAPANVEFTNSTNIAVRNCTFSHLGAEALAFQNGSSNNVVDNNKFEDIAGTAIRIGNGLDFNHNNASNLTKVTFNNTISNNSISNAATEYMAHCGIWLGFVNNNKVVNNRLNNLPYTGISTGYPAPAGAGTLLGSNIIDNNIISNVLTTLRDGGAIYNHAANSGQSFIRNNRICGIRAIAIGNDRAGIYLDEGSSNFVVSGNRGNLSHKVDKAVKQYLTFTNFSKGTEKNNVFKNNIVEDCQ